MSAVRAFFAVDIGRDAADALAQLCAALRGPCADAGLDVGWVRGENLHVTLKFLGQTEEDRVPELAAALGRAIAGSPALQSPPRLQVRGLSAFPSLARPRVLVAGLEGDGASLAGLADLAARCDDVAAAAGFPREERGWRPHVTLGRVRGARRGAGRSGLGPVFERHAAAPLGGPFDIREVVLYESRQTPAGVRYVARARTPLSDPPASKSHS